MSFLHRQLLTAALTANAVYPVPGYAAGVPAMVSGWLTGELAPHLLALTVADSLREAAVGRRDRLGLSLAAGSTAGLVALVAQSLGARRRVDAALVECLGEDYRDRLSARGHRPRPALAPARVPVRLHDDEVEFIANCATPTPAGAACSTSTVAEGRRPAPRCCCRCTVAPGRWAARTTKASR